MFKTHTKKHPELPAHPIYNPAKAKIPLDRAITTMLVALLVVAVAFFLFHKRPQTIKTVSAQMRALSNARQIGLALQLYAGDHNGKFPSYILQEGQPSGKIVTDSNTAFAQLIPTYIRAEDHFWVPESKFCSPKQPDEEVDSRPLDVPVKTLKAGDNEWAYVPCLKMNSVPSMPLIASGFANPVLHTYTTDPNQKGGVWEGKTAVVIRVDGSGDVVNVNQSDMTVHGSNGSARAGDIFTTSNAPNWFGPDNAVVNPK